MVRHGVNKGNAFIKYWHARKRGLDWTSKVLRFCFFHFAVASFLRLVFVASNEVSVLVASLEKLPASFVVGKKLKSVQSILRLKRHVVLKLFFQLERTVTALRMLYLIDKVLMPHVGLIIDFRILCPKEE